MTCFKAVCVATINVPARTDVAAVTQVSRVEAQAGDDGEDVAVPRIDSDPPAATAFAVPEKIARWQRRLEKIGMMQREGNGPRAVVTVIVERAVAAAPEVRFATESVRRPDGGLHVRRGIRWRVGDSFAQNIAAARYNRTIAGCFNLLHSLLCVISRIRIGP